ncbi:MAG: phosphatase PAP2 family protein, partial [Aurantibacter sp.]
PKRSIYLMFESILITDVANLLAKKLVKRRRPFTYNEDLNHEGKCRAYDKDHSNANLSFYSGHTSHVAAVVFFTNTMLWYYKSDYRSKDWAWIVSGAIPAVVGYQRVRAGKHFPFDVLVGYLAGATVGYLVPRIHEKDVDSKDLTGDMLIGMGSGLLIQYALIKIFGNKNKKQDCSSQGQSNWKLSPMFGAYSGIRLSRKF